MVPVAACCTFGRGDVERRLAATRHLKYSRTSCGRRGRRGDVSFRKSSKNRQTHRAVPLGKKRLLAKYDYRAGASFSRRKLPLSLSLSLSLSQNAFLSGESVEKRELVSRGSTAVPSSLSLSLSRARVSNSHTRPHRVLWNTTLSRESPNNIRDAIETHAIETRREFGLFFSLFKMDSAFEKSTARTSQPARTRSATSAASNDAGHATDWNTCGQTLSVATDVTSTVLSLKETIRTKLGGSIPLNKFQLKHGLRGYIKDKLKFTDLNFRHSVLLEMSLKSRKRRR